MFSRQIIRSEINFLAREYYHGFQLLKEDFQKINKSIKNTYKLYGITVAIINYCNLIQIRKYAYEDRESSGQKPKHSKYLIYFDVVALGYCTIKGFIYNPIRIFFETVSIPFMFYYPEHKESKKKFFLYDQFIPTKVLHNNICFGMARHINPVIDQELYLIKLRQIENRLFYLK